MTRPCRCGHSRDAHEHYRPGSDCGACGAARCPRYRPPRRLFVRDTAWPVTFLAGLVRDIGRAPRPA